MLRTLNPTWFATLAMLSFFAGAGYFAYQTVYDSASSRYFTACMQRLSDGGNSWRMENNVAFCRSLWETAMGGHGLYGTQSRTELTLQMTPRPYFVSFR